MCYRLIVRNIYGDKHLTQYFSREYDAHEIADSWVLLGQGRFTATVECVNRGVTTK